MLCINSNDINRLIKSIFLQICKKNVKYTGEILSIKLPISLIVLTILITASSQSVFALPMFEDVASSAGVDFMHTRSDDLMPLGGGVAIGDFNNDDLLDIYVTNSAGPNALYRNNGNMLFDNIAQSAGVDDILGKGNGACFADYDNDGYHDLYVANYGSSKLFHNNGDETFTDVTTFAQVSDPDSSYRTTGCAWGDYNKDGFLDLIVVRHLHELEFEGELYVHFGDSPRPLSLFKNNGDGKFTDVTTLLGDPNANPSPLRRPGFQPVFVDYDNDGDADIHVCNDFGRELKGNVLWRNDGLVQGNWIFTDVSIPSGANSQLYT